MSKKVKPSKKNIKVVDTKKVEELSLETQLKSKSLTELKEIQDAMSGEIEKTHSQRDSEELNLVKTEIKRKNRASQIQKSLMIIPILLILVFLILCIKIEKVNSTENVTRVITKSSNIIPSIDFIEYSRVTDTKYTTYISTLGYLREISSGSNIVVTKIYLYDDFENRIELSLKLDNYKIQLNTNKTYRVEGNYRSSIEGFKLYVDKIVQENKVPKKITNTTTVIDVIPINTTKMSFNINHAISKII